MARTLIIACGNPLRSDDGLGWRAAERLSGSQLPEGVQIIRCHQLTPDLAHTVSRASAVLFIDAAHGSRPGEMVAAPLQPESRSSSLTHQLSPGAIVRLSEELYGAHPRAFTITVCGECFAHGETLSPKVTEALPRLLALVEEILRRPSELNPRTATVQPPS
jgi:hydrogenase maturation protease